jgi:uncharacterized protein YegJ (DUF2314 family)
VIRQLGAAVAAGFVLAGCMDGNESSGEKPAALADNPRFAGEKDTEMRMAAHKAQVSLDEFEQRLKDPPSGQTRIGLRGIFESQGETEYLWLRNVTIVPEGYRGMITSPPTLPGFALDQEVVLPRESVADWFAVEGGYLVAGYSLRLMRSRLSPEERARADEKSGFIIEE